MEFVWIINILLGIMGFILGTGLVMNLRRIHDLEEKVSNLHLIYAKKEDVENDFREIKESLRRIEDAVNRKQDK